MAKIECPVCGMESGFGTGYCEQCGWFFEYLVSELSLEGQKEYENRLGMAKSVWKKRRELEEMIALLTDEKEIVVNKNEELKKEINALIFDNLFLKNKIKDERIEVSKSIMSLEEQIQVLMESNNKIKSEASNRISELENNVQLLVQGYNNLKNKSSIEINELNTQIQNYARSKCEECKRIDEIKNQIQIYVRNISGANKRIKELENENRQHVRSKNEANTRIKELENQIQNYARSNKNEKIGVSEKIYSSEEINRIMKENMQIEIIKKNRDAERLRLLYKIDELKSIIVGHYIFVVVAFIILVVIYYPEFCK